MSLPKLSKKTAVVTIWTILIILFSLTGPFGLSFMAAFSTLAIIPVGLMTYFILSASEPPPNEEITELQSQLSDQLLIIGENEEVIREYEKIFDSQLVEIPCVCGKNAFKALLSPNTENIIECESCKSKYNITISHNSTLLSEPLDERIVVDQLASL
jgi:hypothetical protein